MVNKKDVHIHILLREMRMTITISSSSSSSEETQGMREDIQGVGGKRKAGRRRTYVDHDENMKMIMMMIMLMMLIETTVNGSRIISFPCR